MRKSAAVVIESEMLSPCVILEICLHIHLFNNMFESLQQHFSTISLAYMCLTNAQGSELYLD